MDAHAPNEASWRGRTAGLAELDGLAASEGGRAFLSSLEGTVARCASRWDIEVGSPYRGGVASYVAAARRNSGEPAVLKVPFPHHEAELEPLALRTWEGDGAVLLFEHDEQSGAMLLERCVPGAPLSEVDEMAAIEVIASLLPRLWRAAGSPFVKLTDEAARWRDELPGRYEQAGEPFSEQLLDVALTLLDELPRTSDESVLIHQDLHGGNILSSEREPWLVIDPKPLAGERAMALAPIVRSSELGHTKRAVLGRLDSLCTTLAVDRQRARDWTIAQSLAWAIDGESALPAHVEVAQWLCEDAGYV